jgi:putative oxidoreductase
MSGLLVLPSTFGAFILLLFRAAAGAGWIQHGLMKARGGGWKQAGQWIGGMGIPAFFAPLVATFELVGGVLLIVGLLVPVVALLFFLQMAGIVIMLKTKMHATFLRSGQGGASYEVEFLYLAIALALVAVGAGSISLDALVGLY